MKHLSLFKPPLKIALFYGGRSLEHEISILTALQIYQTFDTTHLSVFLVYVDMEGKMWIGEGLKKRSTYGSAFNQSKKGLQCVTLLPFPQEKRALYPMDESRVNLKDPLFFDLAFLAFHGQEGEDGSFQGLLEMASIPYVGCDAKASQLAMDKYATKHFLRSHGVPVLPDMLLARKDVNQMTEPFLKDLLERKGLQFPLFVKPNGRGSSVGTGKASDFFTLQRALLQAFAYDTHVLVEPCIDPLLEMNIALFRGKDALVSSVIEMPLGEKGGKKHLTYADKYFSSGNKGASLQGEGMAHLPRIIDPSCVQEKVKSFLKSLAETIYDLCRLSGVVRFDFIYDEKTDKLFFNEINPIPGSFAYYLWEESSPPLSITKIAEESIEKALYDFEEKRALERNQGYLALERLGV